MQDMIIDNTYEINTKTTEWWNTGGDCMAAIAEVTIHPEDPVIVEDGQKCSLGYFACMTDEYFCIYDRHPFQEDESDPEPVYEYYLPDYKFNENVGIFVAMRGLYSFYQNCQGHF